MLVSHRLVCKFIIKFSCNARSDRLKQCTLSEYRCTEELSRHRGNMADQFPSFSLGFSLDPDIFFDLENKNENELLASVSLESPVANSTNCTAIEGEISVQVTDQNTEPESNNKTNNQRFVNKSSAEIDDIITRAETKNTKENTKWAIRVFEGEFHFRKCHKLIIKGAVSRCF